MHILRSDFDKKMFFFPVLLGAVIGVLSLWDVSFTTGLMFYGLIFAVIFVSGRTLPLAVLGLTIVSIVFGRIAILSISGRSPDLLYVDMLAVVTTYFWFGEQAIKGEKIKWDILIPAMVYVIVSIGTTLVHSNDPLRELSLLKTLVMGLVLYLIVYNSVETLNDSRRLLSILVLLGLMISAAIVISLGTTGKDFWEAVISDKNIVRLNFGKNNFLAAFFVILIPIAASQISRYRSFPRNFFFIGSLLFMFAVLILTRSRGAILSLALGFLVGGVFILPKRTYFKVLGLASFLVITFLLLLPRDLTFVLADKFVNIMDSGNRERVQMWQVAWHDFLQHPFFGSGVGSTGHIIKASLNIPSLTSPHNYFFEFLAEVGIIGTLSVSYIFATILKNARILSKTGVDARIRSEYAFILIGVISTLLHGLVEPLHRAPQYVVVFWILAGIIAASKRIVGSKAEPDHRA